MPCPARPELLGRRRDFVGRDDLLPSQGPYLQTRRGGREALGASGPHRSRRGVPRIGHVPATRLRRRGASLPLCLRQAVGKPVRCSFMRWGRARLGSVRAGTGHRRTAGSTQTATSSGVRLHGVQPRLDAGDRSAAELARRQLPAPPGGQVDTSPRRSSTSSPTGGSRTRSSTGTPGSSRLWLRAPGAPQATFASEQTIDPLAHDAGIDPIAFRSRTSTRPDSTGVGRRIAVLDAVAKAANWQSKVAASKLGSGNAVKGRGVAIGGFANSFPECRRRHREQEDRQDHGRPSLRGSGCGDDVIRPRREPDGGLPRPRHQPGPPGRGLLHEGANDGNFDWVTYPSLRFKDSP